jgi:flagellar hook-associated protein 2
MGLRSPGIGSNLDVNSIIDQLMTFERRPLTLLTRKQDSYQLKISSYGTLRSSLSTFQTAVQKLNDLNKFQTLKATPADVTLLTAGASASAVPGSYSIETTQLAQAQSVASNAYASGATVLGTGTLSFSYGTYNAGTNTFTVNGSKPTQTVTIDAAHNTVSGIRDAINAAKIGVTASVVSDGSATGTHLVLTSNDSGAANSIRLTVTSTDGLAQQINYDPTLPDGAGQNLTQSRAALNATFNVNGLAITSPTNTITTAIPGVTLNLLKTNTGAPTTLTVARDTTAAAAAVQDFVNAYNDLTKQVQKLTSYDATTHASAALVGDPGTRTIENGLRGIISSAVPGLTGTYTSLSRIGVSFRRDGTLVLDNLKLSSALSANANAVGSLFAASGTTTDSLIAFSGSTNNTKAGTYAVTVNQLATTGTNVGSAAAGLTITAGVNDTLAVSVNGVSATVAIRAGTYASADALAAEVQADINGAPSLVAGGSSVTATNNAGVITLASTRYGSTSTVSVTAGNGRTNLLGAAPTTTTGVDVTGIINGAAVTGSGQFLTGNIGNLSEGLKLQITGGPLGSRGNVVFSQGVAYQLDKKVGSYLDTKGLIAAKTDGFNKSISQIDAQKAAFNKRLTQVENRYRAQFTALDKLVASFTATQSFLTQQINQLPGNNPNNR